MATAEATTREFDDATKEMGDKLVELTLLQAKALADYMEDVHGIEPASGGAMMVAAPADGDGEGGGGEVEQTEFDVILNSFGDSKIAVIKAVRSATGVGLKEAKELVESAPKPIKEGLPKDEAERLQKEIADAGADVEVK